MDKKLRPTGRSIGGKDASSEPERIRQRDLPWFGVAGVAGGCALVRDVVERVVEVELRGPIHPAELSRIFEERAEHAFIGVLPLRDDQHPGDEEAAGIAHGAARPTHRSAHAEALEQTRTEIIAGDETPPISLGLSVFIVLAIKIIEAPGEGGVDLSRGPADGSQVAPGSLNLRPKLGDGGGAMVLRRGEGQAGRPVTGDVGRQLQFPALGGAIVGVGRSKNQIR